MSLLLFTFGYMFVFANVGMDSTELLTRIHGLYAQLATPSKNSNESRQRSTRNVHRLGS